METNNPEDKIEEQLSNIAIKLSGLNADIDEIINIIPMNRVIKLLMTALKSKIKEVSSEVNNASLGI